MALVHVCPNYLVLQHNSLVLLTENGRNPRDNGICKDSSVPGLGYTQNYFLHNPLANEKGTR
jgi:hypothetical protein